MEDQRKILVRTFVHCNNMTAFTEGIFMHYMESEM